MFTGKVDVRSFFIEMAGNSSRIFKEREGVTEPFIISTNLMHLMHLM
jgi:hypothetical protein